MAHVLLIEPDRLLAESYLQALQAAGHEVVACAGAQTAIQAADQTRPDVVILELQLVEHSGVEFLYEFRSYPDWQTIPVVVQSYIPSVEFADNQQSLRGQLGVTAYLYKPRTTLRQLVAAVNRQLAVPR
jgi:DNA-binding response OmpR family regulator